MAPEQTKRFNDICELDSQIAWEATAGLNCRKLNMEGKHFGIIADGRFKISSHGLMYFNRHFTQELNITQFW